MSSKRNTQDLLAEISDLQDKLQAQLEVIAELLIHKQQLDAIFDNAPVELYLKDREGRYLKINRHFEKLFNVRNEDIIGLFPEDVHDPDLALTTRDQDLAVLKTGKIESRMEKAKLEHDGLLHTLLTIKFPVFDASGNIDGIGAIASDITEQRNAEARFQHIFMSAPIGLVLANTETLELIEANSSYCEFIGRSKQEIQKLGWQSQIHPDDLAKELALLEKMHSKEIDGYSIEKRYFKPDGQVVWAEGHVSIVGNPREPSSNLYLVMLQDVTERKKYEEKIWHQANYDPLTGLPNRSMLLEKLGRFVIKEGKAENHFALLFVDLDGFKEVNDSLGHIRGDELLVEVSKRIKSALDDSDTAARLGGDEFVIIAPNISDQTDVAHKAQLLIDEIARPFLIADRSVHISASVGSTLFPVDSTETIGLVRNADRAMYAAKKMGRGRYQSFTEILELAADERTSIISDMHIAISRQQFRLYYQPIIQLSSGEVHKAEALLRWKHDSKGIINPSEFIALAEETGLIHEIGEQVFEQATEQAAIWSFDTYRDLQICINISAVQFGEPLKIQEFIKYCRSHDLSIDVEITESVLMESNPWAIDTLLQLKDAGIQVALDDFGTGYSSLSYLRKFDIDYLKIDRSFVRNLAVDSDDLALCRAIIVMAHTLGIKVIAEGIESKQQKDLLIGLGCDYGQGFYFSKPLPASEFESYYQRQPRRR